ncbi:hypothetical protein ABW19_dt0205291 [Dactylella cylindrospora]|nr:hypothetical protein ABW19_dt0205291 [Dactylella cylindrospora]
MPLAERLGLEVDTSCDRDDEKCVRKAVDKFQEKKSNEGKAILICWEHDALSKIAKNLDVGKVKEYPSHRFDLIWQIKDGKIETASEGCPGLDD